MARMVAEVRFRSLRCTIEQSMPIRRYSSTMKLPIASLPTQATVAVDMPSLAAFITAPAAVPAGFIRISSMKATFPPSGIASTVRPAMSRMVRPTKVASNLGIGSCLCSRSRSLSGQRMGRAGGRTLAHEAARM